MTDVDPQEQAWSDALGPEKPPAEPSPEELYIRRQRAGGSVEPQEATSEPARDEAGRFVKAEQPEEAPQEELSSHEAVDFLMGRQVSEEELAERQQAQAMLDLSDGTAVRDYAEQTKIADRSIALLRDENPGIDSEQAIAEMQPIFNQLAAEYGPAAEDPLVVEQIFHEINADGHLSPDPQTEAWSEKSLGIEPSRSAFTR
jgi:hypothetical protein